LFGNSNSTSYKVGQIRENSCVTIEKTLFADEHKMRGAMDAGEYPRALTTEAVKTNIRQAEALAGEMRAG
jgi:hypothetical protein